MGVKSVLVARLVAADKAPAPATPNGAANVKLTAVKSSPSSLPSSLQGRSGKAPPEVPPKISVLMEQADKSIRVEPLIIDDSDVENGKAPLANGKLEDSKEAKVLQLRQKLQERQQRISAEGDAEPPKRLEMEGPPGQLERPKPREARELREAKPVTAAPGAWSKAGSMATEKSGAERERLKKQLLERQKALENQVKRLQQQVQKVPESGKRLPDPAPVKADADRKREAQQAAQQRKFLEDFDTEWKLERLLLRKQSLEDTKRKLSEDLSTVRRKRAKAARLTEECRATERQALEQLRRHMEAQSLRFLAHPEPSNALSVSDQAEAK